MGGAFGANGAVVELSLARPGRTIMAAGVERDNSVKPPLWSAVARHRFMSLNLGRPSGRLKSSTVGEQCGEPGSNTPLECGGSTPLYKHEPRHAVRPIQEFSQVRTMGRQAATIQNHRLHETAPEKRRWPSISTSQSSCRHRSSSWIAQTASPVSSSQGSVEPPHSKGRDRRTCPRLQNRL